MFCRNCGSNIEDNVAYCPHCGYATGIVQVPMAPPQQKEEGNGMAIAGFVCSFFVPLLGWIFGGIGLSRSNKRNGKGKSLSIAALIIATVNWAVSFALML